MSQSKNDLAEKISALSADHWDNTKTPLLLSQLGPHLKASGFNYKEILGGQSLGNFIASDVDKQTISKHPTQFAKIGIHPATETFSYMDAPPTTKPEQSEAERLKRRRRAFYGFIEAISELPPEDINGITIPARVIVRLLEGK